jgi:hypothetical protein
MLKNPVKATEIYYDTHDCKPHGKYILDRGWLTMQKESKESLDGLFKHVRPVNNSNFNATGDFISSNCGLTYF